MTKDQLNKLESLSDLDKIQRTSESFDLDLLDEKLTNFRASVFVSGLNKERIDKCIKQDQRNKSIPRANLIIPSRERHCRIKNDQIKNNKNFWSSGVERTNIVQVPLSKGKTPMNRKEGDSSRTDSQTESSPRPANVPNIQKLKDLLSRAINTLIQFGTKAIPAQEVTYSHIEELTDEQRATLQHDLEIQLNDSKFFEKNASKK